MTATFVGLDMRWLAPTRMRAAAPSSSCVDNQAVYPLIDVGPVTSTELGRSQSEGPSLLHMIPTPVSCEHLRIAFPQLLT